MKDVLEYRELSKLKQLKDPKNVAEEIIELIEKLALMKIAFISDIHANIFALEQVYEDLDKEKVEKILVAGDLIGYYYWPKEVIDLLRSDQRFIMHPR